MKYIIFGTLIVLVYGCAQPILPSEIVSQPTTKNFSTCGLRVQFSGKPEELQGALLDNVIVDFGVKPVDMAWIYSSNMGNISKREIAFCVCPNTPKLNQWRGIFADPNNFVVGVGRVAESPVKEIEDNVKMLTKMAFDNTASCYMVQHFVSKGTPQIVKEGAAPFFSSLGYIPKEPEQPTSVVTSGSGSAPERLKQLESLLGLTQIIILKT